jgi:hypothetical protein
MVKEVSGDVQDLSMNDQDKVRDVGNQIQVVGDQLEQVNSMSSPSISTLHSGPPVISTESQLRGHNLLRWLSPLDPSTNDNTNTLTRMSLLLSLPDEVLVEILSHLRASALANNSIKLSFILGSSSTSSVSGD